MRVLVVYAHPVETSFVSALHEAVVATLRKGGHEVDDCDLYAEAFDPVLSRQNRIDYHDPALNHADVAGYVERLRAAEALVLVHPVWNFGFPAILKGYFDRVFLPGVSFEIDARGNLEFTLRHIRKLASVCTYGGSRWRAVLAGDPTRSFVKRVLRAHIARDGSCEYLAHYDMNHTRPDRRAAFLARVEQRLTAWR